MLFLKERASRRAYTGIVLALLAPNFAPRGSGVSKSRNDARSLATANDAYFVDHNAYPGYRPLASFAKSVKALEKANGAELYTVDPGTGPGYCGLTTPIAYVESLLPDPYAPEKGMPFAYFTDGGGWILLSPGPDKDYDVNPTTDYDSTTTQPSERLMVLAYDPTNGTVSDGDLCRVKQ